ncbi:hypothetical protein [uncultured Polaribacter sp.]|uniref:hypothetical protein n=1 Tax=uncultured Polaribacter sp. TaxID=174711 RepID=UPI00260DF23E|nr:hypothetical protein [uncultured Polaribacter sp.]
MKKGILLLFGLFMMVSTVEASHNNKLLIGNGFDYSYTNAVNFVERGIEFYVFTNGEFDFDTNYRNRGVRIHRDYRGRIRNIGNVFVNYDSYGNVSRIGNIFIRYHRGRLARVGNLRVDYDRWGLPVFRGYVNDNFYYHNGVRFSINFGDVCNYDDAYFYGRDFRRNYSQIREDRNFYYYRANTNARIGSRSKILRRKKPSVTNNRRTIENATRDNSSRRYNTTTSTRKSYVKRSNIGNTRSSNYKKLNITKRNDKDLTKRSKRKGINDTRSRRN